MSAQHAKLSASGAHRWMACPGSVRLEELYPDTQTEYSVEGTVAHMLAEVNLSLNFGKELRNFSEEEERNFSNYVDEEMEAAINDFCGYINDLAEQMQRPSVFLETRVNFDTWVPGGYGTADVLLIDEKRLILVDLKYGKGVAVQAEQNPQLKLYALGAIQNFMYLSDFEKVEMHVYQPRINNISSATMAVDELLHWGETEVKPKALAALKKDAPFSPGDHCRFCKAKGGCRALAEKNLKEVQAEFQKTETLSNDEIASLILFFPKLKEWIKAVEELALKKALDGEQLAGLKVVAGRSLRKLSDADLAARKLIEAGYEESVLYERNMLSLAKLEKALGKKNINETIGDFIVKPEGKPTLVAETDAREAFDSLSAFEILE